MKRLSLTIGVGILSLGLVACTKAGSSDKKLDEIKTELAALTKKMDQLVPDAPSPNARGNKKAAGRLGNRRAIANNTPLGRIERELRSLKQMIARGGGRGANKRRRPGPDANTVYSVPIAGSAATGPKHALVTIVSGFEFA